jgi:hypothetical protein
MFERFPGLIFLFGVLFVLYAVVTAHGNITALFIVSLVVLLGIDAKLESLSRQPRRPPRL